MAAASLSTERSVAFAEDLHSRKQANALVASDLASVQGGQPRIMDLRLAEALGFERPDRIRSLIERHRGALEVFGEVFTTVVKTTAKGGRPGKAFWLNQRQAIFICAKSETERATEITIEVVEVFAAVASGTSSAGQATGLAQKGLALFRLGSRTVLVDTERYRLDGEQALVMRHDGKLAVERVTYDFGEDRPNLGKRNGLGPWKKAKPGSHYTASRAALWIIGAIVEPTSSPLLRAH